MCVCVHIRWSNNSVIPTILLQMYKSTNDIRHDAPCVMCHVSCVMTHAIVPISKICFKLIALYYSKYSKTNSSRQPISGGGRVTMGPIRGGGAVCVLLACMRLNAHRYRAHTRTHTHTRVLTPPLMVGSAFLDNNSLQISSLP